MTALHDRIPNFAHEAHVLAVRREMCAHDPLAIERALRRGKAYPRWRRILRRAGT